MSDNRPSVYFDDDKGVWVYRVSSSGDCVRALVAIGLDYQGARDQDTEAMLERAANEGNLHEGAVREGLEGMGFRFWDYEDSADNVFEVPVIPGVILRGHPDGLGEYTGEGGYKELDPPLDRITTPEVILEVKSMSRKVFSKWSLQGFEAFPKYASQISVEMQAFPGRDVIYAVKRRDDGLVNYTIIPHDEPPVDFATVRKKIVTAEKYRRKGGEEMPPCSADANKFFCPFWYLHDEEEEQDQEDHLTEEMEAVLGELVYEYKRLKEIEDAGKEAEKARKKINPEILSMLGELDQAKVAHKGRAFQVTRRAGGGSRLDTDRLRLDLGEEKYAEYETKYRFEYPVIKELEMDNTPEEA